MKTYQKQFIEFIISKKILTFGEFTLKSGRNSSYFFNIGSFNTGKDLGILGHFYSEALLDSGINFDCLFGPAYKGIPIVIVTSAILATYYKCNVPYCFNRKEAKNHGEKGNLIGSSLIGKVMLVDDVITDGTTIRESINIIHSSGATLAGIIVSLDRQEVTKNGISAVQEIEQDYDCQVISIITLSDLIKYFKTHSCKKITTLLQKHTHVNCHEI